MTLYASSWVLATVNIDCLAIDLNCHFAILHCQGLPCLPVLQLFRYHANHALRDCGLVQFQFDWSRHLCVSVIDDDEGHVVGGDAQKRVHQVVRPKGYSGPVLERWILLAQTYKIPGPLEDRLFFAVLRKRVAVQPNDVPFIGG